jgi:DNA-binding CsgD family transcriptional regulator
MSILEAAYAGASDADEWLRDVFATVGPALDSGLGAVAYRFAHMDQGFWMGERLLSDDSPVLVTTSDCLGALSKCSDKDAIVRRSFPRAPTVGSFLEQSQLRQEDYMAAFPTPGSGGMRDSLGLVGGNPSGRGCVIAAATRSRAILPRSAKALWTRVAAHLAAGYRLALENDARVDAVLKPDGRLEHLESSAVDRAGREALSEATRHVDKARGRLRRTDPERALDLWQGLVEGRWTLIDHIDHDGRRYVFAKRNPPDARPWHTLTQDETSVVIYAAHGQSHKTIAYELGVSVAAVGQRLAKAARKVGVRSRLELVAAYQREASDRASDRTPDVVNPSMTSDPAPVAVFDARGSALSRASK